MTRHVKSGSGDLDLDLTTVKSLTTVRSKPKDLTTVKPKGEGSGVRSVLPNYPHHCFNCSLFPVCRNASQARSFVSRYVGAIVIRRENTLSAIA